MQSKSALFFAVFYCFVAFTIRFAEVAPNVSAMGALCLFCGCFLKGWQAPLLGLGTLFASDVFGSLLQISDMGWYNHWTMLFVYGGFGLMIAFGRSMRSIPVGMLLSGGIVGSGLFFLSSNFGAWLDPRMGHEWTTAGLLRCYVDGIPFHKVTFLCDVAFNFVFVGLYLLLPMMLTRSKMQSERVRR